MAKNTWKKLDASDKILGRLCSQVAKKALLGEQIVIVNAKNAVISGNRNTTLKKYVDLMEVRTATNPTHGPFHSSRPDTFLRQRVKGMLPAQKQRGKKALRRMIADCEKGTKLLDEFIKIITSELNENNILEYEEDLREVIQKPNDKEIFYNYMKQLKN